MGVCSAQFRERLPLPFSQHIAGPTSSWTKRNEDNCGMAEDYKDALRTIKTRLDEGSKLRDEHFHLTLNQLVSHNAAHFCADVNQGAPSNRVVLLDPAANARNADLIEEYLVRAGRRGVLILIPAAALESREDREDAPQRQDIYYSKPTKGGRVSFFPTNGKGVVGGALPTQRKGTGSTRRTAGGESTMIKIHETKQLEPVEAPALPVCSVERAGGRKLRLTLLNKHSFSGGRSLVWVEHLHPRLDGRWWKVFQAKQGEYTLQLEAVQLTEEEVDQISERLDELHQAQQQQAVMGAAAVVGQPGQPMPTVRDAVRIDTTWTLVHYFCPGGEDEAQAQPDQGGTEQVPAAGPTSSLDALRQGRFAASSGPEVSSAGAAAAAAPLRLIPTPGFSGSTLSTASSGSSSSSGSIRSSSSSSLRGLGSSAGGSSSAGIGGAGMGSAAVLGAEGQSGAWHQQHQEVGVGSSAALAEAQAAEPDTGHGRQGSAAVALAQRFSALAVSGSGSSFAADSAAAGQPAGQESTDTASGHFEQDAVPASAAEGRSGTAALSGAAAAIGGTGPSGGLEAWAGMSDAEVVAWLLQQLREELPTGRLYQGLLEQLGREQLAAIYKKAVMGEEGGSMGSRHSIDSMDGMGSMGSAAAEGSMGSTGSAGITGPAVPSGSTGTTAGGAAVDKGSTAPVGGGGGGGGGGGADSPAARFMLLARRELMGQEPAGRPVSAAMEAAVGGVSRRPCSTGMSQLQVDGEPRGAGLGSGSAPGEVAPAPIDDVNLK